MKHHEPLDAILVEAVNEGLSSICGSAGPAVIFFLKNNGSIRSKTEIDSVESLSEGLESIFGFGSKVIEKRILEVLYFKLQLAGKQEAPSDFDFTKEVERAFELSAHVPNHPNGIEFGVKQIEPSRNMRGSG